MKILKAYQYRLKTTPELETQLFQILGCNRFVWNKALAMSRHRLENKQSILWYQEMAYWLTLWKKSDEYAFLKDAPSQSLQQTLMALGKAWQDGFDKTQPDKRLPVFKKRNARNGFRFPQGFKIDGNRIQLPKLGWIRFFKSRDIEGTPKNVTVTHCAGRWTISVQVELTVADPVHPSRSVVGVDLGVERLLTLSDGRYFDPINSYKKQQHKLARAQRRLKHKTQFSNNWKKQQRRVAKLHAKIADQRNDRLHWISHHLSQNHAMVIIEDLNVKNMSASAKGTLEKPGRRVNAKAGLNKAILDQGWGNFRRYLEYKMAWKGGTVVAVDPKYTSQTCPVCSHVSAGNRRSQSEFECTACHYKNNADIVGALNVLARGHRVLACGDGGRLDTSVKQEPRTDREDCLT